MRNGQMHERECVISDGVWRIALPFLMLQSFAVSIIMIIFVKANALTIAEQALTIQITLQIELRR